ncbi:MAG: hypothetical protein ACXWVD_00440 [Telluria sp.]
MSAPVPQLAMRHLYVLNEQRVPVPCPDPIAWGQWMAADGLRVVAQDALGDWHGVSTVFLGYDMSMGHGAPLLFETMLFIDGQAGPLVRSRSWDEAAAMHQRVCQELRDALAKEGPPSFALARRIIETIASSKEQP